jgi:hypothetical protein
MPYNIPLLLLPLLGGFVFIRNWYRTRWHTKRAEKDRLLFHASLAGLACLALATVIASIPPFIPCVSKWICLPTWWGWLKIPGDYAGTATLSFLIGAILWKPWNYVQDKRCKGKSDEIEAARIIRDYGGPLEQTLYRSIEQEKLVMLTLTNGKVYIGGIAETFIPDDKIVFIYPTRSGYRDSSTQRLELTTPYDLVYKSIARDKPETYREILADFRVAIPIEFVLSASLYLPEIHSKYFPHKVDTCPDPLPFD